jgi:alpha-D-ribose 1-methylphosphonate 5-triphosphate synthase subunit PhnH
MSATNSVFYPRVNGSTPGVSLTVSSSAVAPSALSNAVGAVYFTVQNDAVYMTLDGTVPSSTNGHELPVNYSDMFHSETFAKARFIRKTGDARIHYQEMAC